MPQSTAPSLQVQLVLFKPDSAAVRRVISGLGASLRYARAHGSITTATLAIGDCSPERLVEKSTETELLSQARTAGFTQASFTFFAENLGSAGGSNRLAQGADSDFLLVMNPDTYPSPGLLHHLVSAFRPGVGVVEGRQLPVEHPKAADPQSGEVSWASGACSLFSLEAFREVGGYDIDHFFLHCDDVDISWRLKLAGYEVIHEPSATILHHKPLTTSGKVVAPEIEQYYGALGRLMLATRYGRQDIVDQTLTSIAAQDTHPRLEAAAEFLRRKRENELPEPLPDAELVAQFVGSEYAVHRF